MKIAILTKYGFDPSENKDPIYIESVNTFIDNGERGLSLFGKVACYIENLEPQKRQLGYDGVFYPIFKIEYSDAI